MVGLTPRVDGSFAENGGETAGLIHTEDWSKMPPRPLGPATHPRILGAPEREAWAEIWRSIEPEVPRPMVTGPTVQGEHILLAENNADMRAYLMELLSPHWKIEVVSDGQAALQAMRRRRPDLLIADAMMPRLDGLPLVAAVRADSALESLSVILLSARAGEEAQAEGLTAGADDYLVKPFAPQELLARVKAALSLGRLRHYSAESVARAEARLRAATELVGLSSYSWDPMTDALECDDQIRAIWGLSQGTPVDGTVFRSGIHPDDRPRVEAAMGRCTDPRGSGICSLEYRVIGDEDHVERWVHTCGRTIFDDGEAVGFIGAVMEITHRKQAEARLRESEQRLRSLAEHINAVLWIADPATDAFEYVSPAYNRIWGEVRDSFRPTIEHWKRNVHPHDLHYVAAAQRRVARGEMLTYEYRIVRPDGSTRWIRDTSFPIRDEDGRVWRIAGVATDISPQGGARVYLIRVAQGQNTPLAALLRDKGYEVKTFPSLETFVEVAPVLVAGCALLDLQTAEGADLQLLMRNRAGKGSLRIVVLGAAGDGISAVVAAMRAGAIDYVPFPFNDRQVVDAIASASTHIDHAVMPSESDAEAVSKLSRLSHRERQVLDGILAGGTNKSIAQLLALSPRTVEMHRSRMMEKIGAQTLREAIEVAFRAGLRR